MLNFIIFFIACVFVGAFCAHIASGIICDYYPQAKPVKPLANFDGWAVTAIAGMALLVLLGVLVTIMRGF